MSTVKWHQPIISLALLRFAYFLDFMIMMPLGRQLMEKLDLTAAQFGLIVSSFTIAAGVSGLMGATIIDRFPKKYVLLFAFANFTLATFLCGLCESYLTLLASRIYAGTFGGIITALIYSITSDLVSYQNRGKAMGILMAASSLAFILGPCFSILSTQYTQNWSTPFTLLSFLCFFVLVISCWYLPASKKVFRTPSSIFAPYIAIYKNPSMIYGCLLVILLALGQYSIIPYLSPYLEMNLHVSERELTLLLTLGGFFSVITSLLFGKLTDWMGKHSVAKILISLSILSTLLITNFASQQLVLIAFSVTLFFITTTGRLVPSQAIISSVSPPEFQSSFMSVQNSIQQFASGFASYLGSLIIIKEQNQITHLNTLGLVAISFSLLALLITNKLKRA